MDTNECATGMKIEVEPKHTTFIAARFGSTLSSEGTQFCFAAKRDTVVELVAAPTKRRFANRAITNVDDLPLLVQFSSFSTVVPNRLVATPMSTLAPMSTLHISTLCGISAKPKHG